jgi:hypothetical protein
MLNPDDRATPAVDEPTRLQGAAPAAAPALPLPLRVPLVLG